MRERFAACTDRCNSGRNMRRILYFVQLLYIITGYKAALLSKRQTSCPSNCFRCDGGVCIGCNSGWYGDDCSKSCSKCPGGCHQNTGHCLCPAGTFGPSCGQKCPTNCRRLICNNTNGQCDGGCTDGYHGDTCLLPCGHCRNGSCDQKTGQCNSGCRDGWGGGDCNVQCILHCVECTNNDTCLECSGGYYGRRCRDTSTSIQYTTHTSSVKYHTTPHDEDTTVNGVTIGIAVGVSLTLLVIILVVVVIVLIKNRQSITCPICKRKEKRWHKDDEYGSQILNRDPHDPETTALNTLEGDTGHS